VRTATAGALAEAIEILMLSSNYGRTYSTTHSAWSGLMIILPWKSKLELPVPDI